MKSIRTLAIALVAMLALAACSDTTGTDSSTVSSLAGDLTEMANDVQSNMDDLATQIEGSESAADLQSSWNEVRTEMAAALTAVTTGATVDTEAIQNSLDEFQASLEAVRDDVGDDVVNSWNDLRSQFEQLIS